MPFTPRTLAAVLIAVAAPLAAQERVAARIEAEPSSLTVRRGAEATLRIRAVAEDGRALDVPLRVTGQRSALAVTATADGQWTVRGVDVGAHEIVAVTVVDEGATPVLLRIPVEVEWPPVARIEIQAPDAPVYAGTRVPHTARVILADGGDRAGAPVQWSTTEPDVAMVDRFGVVRAQRPGRTRLVAEFDGVRGSHDLDISPLRLASLEITGADAQLRTGDVQTLRAVAKTSDGTRLEDLAVTWSHAYTPDDSIQAPQAPAQLDADGRFVASVPGVHTVFASAAGLQAEASFSVRKRDVVRRVEIVGQGREQRVFTTDFWIFEGVDGRDYAFTGSKMGDGITFVWDVTDPANIVKTDSIQVDARTTNDVKVSPDGRWAAISREGASNRRNGVVLLDLADPAHPTVASIYDEGLTGGVHNMFATETHLFALSAGDKYIILDVSDLSAPRYVSEYDHPDSRVHDREAGFRHELCPALGVDACGVSVRAGVHGSRTAVRRR